MTYFHEEQSFGPWRLGVVLAIVVIPIAFLAVEGTLRPVPLAGSIVAIAIFIPVAVLFLAARLVVDVTAPEIRVSFHFLWPTRRIAIESVRRAHARRYNPLFDYGGCRRDH